MRQIPYTMMKFAAFERTVEFLYKHVVPVPRDQLGKPSQLVVTFAAGYIAGVFCAVVSHPADSVVSKLNSMEGSTAWQAAKDLGMAGQSKILKVCGQKFRACIKIAKLLLNFRWYKDFAQPPVCCGHAQKVS